MIISPLDLAEIVAKASSLSERLSHLSLRANAAQGNEKQVSDRRLKRWCEVVAQGNWEKFHKRLQWDELDLDKIRQVLDFVPVVEGQSLPAWAETLREIIQTIYSFVNQEIPPQNLPFPIEQDKPFPYQELLLPVLLVARQKLLTRLGIFDQLPLELLSESAYLALERSLLDRLLNLSGKTLEYEFARSLPVGRNIISLLGKTPVDKEQIKAHYAEFIRKLLSDGSLTFFQSYPVLARLIATAIDLWVESTAEFLQNLKKDLPELKQLFQPDIESRGAEINGVSLGKAIEIKPSLSDPHNGGRVVIALAFESGLKLVYKPKGLGAEAAYIQILDWCNRQGIPLGFKVLKVCDRQTHGWVEYIEHLPCENEAAAERFYQRAGMLLCLLYALRVVDCHCENLIANGEHLVLIDMEALMHQEVNLLANQQEATEADTTVNSHFLDSVLRTGLLPRWEFTKNNRIAYDNSALGGIDLLTKLTEVEPNNSANSKTPQSPIPPHIPILNKVPLSPHNYLDHILTGFNQMYRFLIEKRESLLAPNSPLAALQNQRVRFIFRATKIYGAILQKSFEPQSLRDGIDRSIELDILSRAFLIAPEKPKAWPIFHAELKAMEQLDIPYFAAYPNSDALTFGLEQPIEQYFQETSYRAVLQQIQTLNETNLTQQIEIIKGSFYARVARNAQTGVYSSPLPTEPLNINPLTPQQLIQEATRIASEIQERAIWGTDGSVKWISFGYIPTVERFQLMPLPQDLYNGNSGMGLFLAALDYVRNNRQFRDLAFACFQPIRKFLQTADFESTRRFVRCGIGGATGLSSMIYALVRASQFLGEAALLEDALGIANLIAPELIAADKQFDIMGGAAGAILGLLVVYAATGEPKVLEKAITCGQHLLAHQISINHAPKAWKILGQKQYTGFSHGAAGIAYALLRLYEVTQDNVYLKAASEGIAYERSVFSPVAGNWPDLRDFAQQNGQPGFMVSWCHGAAGIGLARLGGLSVLATDEIHQDVEVALQTTQKHRWHDVDCICCGNWGRIELLLVASQKLSSPPAGEGDREGFSSQPTTDDSAPLKKAAEHRAAWAVRRAEQTGGYQFPNLPNSVFSPSFFQGTAGIGYELLRLAYPEALPSVLLWD